jgi:hypothetical protein
VTNSPAAPNAFDMPPGSHTALLLIGGIPDPIEGIVTVEQEWIDATPMTEVDPNWVHVDGHSHTHRWMAGPDPLVPLLRPQRQTPVLPTLIRVPDYEDHWCEECEGDWQPSHYECRICGDVVAPASRAFIGRNYIPGIKHWSVEVHPTSVVLPVGRVSVTLLTDPPWVFPGQVTSSDSEYGISGRRHTANIVPLAAPMLATP